MKKTIVVIFGGRSSEYEVSLSSAYATLTHMNKNLYEIITIGITRQGEWLLYQGEYEHIKNDTWNQRDLKKVLFSPEPMQKQIIVLDKKNIETISIDAVFPILHGKNGEDGTIQGILQIAGIPIIGCDLLSSALCMDKDLAHRVVSTIGVRVPKSVVITSKELTQEERLKIKQLSFPLFVKPMKAGSSLGILKISQEEELLPAIMHAFSYDNTIIIEENIDGFEVGCAIIGNKELFIGEVDEIELTSGFFDFTEKYTLQSSKIHLPANITEEMKQKVQQTAKEIYKVLGCKVLARVDMFITPDSEIVFNEVNTIPGFTTHSRFPNMIKQLGISFSDMLVKVIEEGLNSGNDPIK